MIIHTHRIKVRSRQWCAFQTRNRQRDQRKYHFQKVVTCHHYTLIEKQLRVVTRRASFETFACPHPVRSVHPQFNSAVYTKEEAHQCTQTISIIILEINVLHKTYFSWLLCIMYKRTQIYRVQGLINAYLLGCTIMFPISISTSRARVPVARYEYISGKCVWWGTLYLICG